jgi:hypothetical protein
MAGTAKAHLGQASPAPPKSHSLFSTTHLITHLSMVLGFLGFHNLGLLGFVDRVSRKIHRLAGAARIPKFST